MGEIRESKVEVRDDMRSLNRRGILLFETPSSVVVQFVVDDGRYELNFTQRTQLDRSLCVGLCLTENRRLEVIKLEGDTASLIESLRFVSEVEVREEWGRVQVDFFSEKCRFVVHGEVRSRRSACPEGAANDLAKCYARLIRFASRLNPDPAAAVYFHGSLRTHISKVDADLPIRGRID